MATREQLKQWLAKANAKENMKFILPFVAAVFLTLWIFFDNKPKDAQPQDVVTEIGVVIPKGFLVVPLQLNNATTLDSLVQRNAIVDLFQPGQRVAVVENLRILKLSAGEGPAFGALVPDKMAGAVQDLFSRPNLRAAIRTMNSGPTQFHLSQPSHKLLVEIPTGDET